jgi:putative transposase
MANQADFPVRTQCRVLGISASGFYAWLERPPSRRALDNAVMSERIRTIHKPNRMPSTACRKVRAELMAQGQTISRKRVRA